MKKHIIVYTLLLAACSGGISGKQELVQSGSSTTYVTLRFEFVDQLRQLCAASYLQSDFIDGLHYQQAVANCVFSHLNAVGATAPSISSFQSQFCTNIPTNLTPEEQVSILSTCTLFNAPI